MNVQKCQGCPTHFFWQGFRFPQDAYSFIEGFELSFIGSMSKNAQIIDSCLTLILGLSTGVL